MSGVEADAFAAALHQEMLDEGATRAEAVEMVEQLRLRPFWNDVAALWVKDRSQTPFAIVSAKRREELRDIDDDALDPSARLLKFLDAHPEALSELCAMVEEELVFDGITARFNDD